MLKHYNLKNLIIIFWTLLLLSINTNADFLSKIFNTQYGFNLEYIINSLNLIRFFLPFVIFFFLIYLILLNFNKINKINKFFYFLFFYSLWQIVIFYLNNRNYNHLFNTQLIISMFCIIMLFAILEIYSLQFIFKKLLIIFLFYTSLVLLTYLIISIIENYRNYTIYLYYSINPDINYLYQVSPRITGLSRIALILFYFFSFYYAYNKKNNKIFIFIILNILSLIIYLSQSRGTYLGFIIFIIYYLLFIKKKIIGKVFFVTSLIIIPIFIASCLNYLQHKNLQKFVADPNMKIEDRNTYLERFNSKNNIRIINEHKDSGRIQIWKNSINIILKEKIILGMGPQSDRYLLEKHFKKSKNTEEVFYENNASNALIYSFLCGGIIGLILLLTIYYFFSSELLKTLTNKGNFNSKNMLFHFSYITIIFLMVRSIYENSFAVFSLDYCLILLSYFTLYNINRNIKSTNSL